LEGESASTWLAKLLDRVICSEIRSGDPQFLGVFLKNHSNPAAGQPSPRILEWITKGEAKQWHQHL
jgi:hypothetical protein